MSAARDLFLQLPPMPINAGKDVYDQLCRCAQLWREGRQHFSAGLAMFDASDSAWGRPDLMLSAVEVGFQDLERAISENPVNSPESIAALYKLIQSLSRSARMFDVDQVAYSARIRELRSELGQRLFKHYKNSDHADNYLVRGIVITTDRDGSWDVRFPDYEVPLGFEQRGPEVLLNIPSAFHLFTSNAEWQAASEIVVLQKDAFTSPGLRGWRAVTLSNVNPTEAVERFDEAADAFASDVMPETDAERTKRGGHWSSINRNLWAKYYRARARLLESIRRPEKVKELLDHAAEALTGTEAGWHSGDVSRFHVLIKVLSNLLSDPLSIDPEQARREYRREIDMSFETEEDRLTLSFISEAVSAFRGFANDPASELTHGQLSKAITALARLPTIGPEVESALRPAIGRKALSTILGPVRTWIHRSLESISDEAAFRRLLLRLLQSGLPRYAQIRHGPLEYGKDISVLLDENGRLILRPIK
ncbi:MAG TPA: LysR family transcriptional regulator [Stellaceae bacterium]|nr:LysR family transcriptional regulator [Stellaceae bacterium]